jgi:hypothetical protein
MEELENTKKLEMINFCQLNDTNSLRRYELIKQILEVEFHQSEFDILRKEIGRCYVIAAYQACITLTNHLLERYCKILLIHIKSDFKIINNLESLESQFEEGIKAYSDKDLNITLNALRTLNIISKEERKELDKYRDIFRNGFSHTNPEQILGDKKGAFIMGNFISGEIGKTYELTLSKIPFLQGVAIEGFAKENALEYILVVENLIRKTINNINAEVNQVKYELLEIVKSDE